MENFERSNSADENDFRMVFSKFQAIRKDVIELDGALHAGNSSSSSSSSSSTASPGSNNLPPSISSNSDQSVTDEEVDEADFYTQNTAHTVETRNSLNATDEEFRPNSYPPPSEVSSKTLWDVYHEKLASDQLSSLLDFQPTFPEVHEDGELESSPFDNENIKGLQDLNEEDADEWDNDDDTGVVMVPISEEEFLELEEEAAIFQDEEYLDDEDEEDDGEEVDSLDQDIEVAISALNGKVRSMKDTFGKEMVYENDDGSDNERLENDDIGDRCDGINGGGSDGDDGVHVIECTLRDSGIEDEKCVDPSTSRIISMSPNGQNKPVYINQNITEGASVNQYLSEEGLRTQSEDKNKDQEVNEHNEKLRGRSHDAPCSVMGQRTFRGCDGDHCMFNLKVIFDPFRTGFEDSKQFVARKGDIIAGRYQVTDMLGHAAFSSAIQCYDTMAEKKADEWVCLKIIKNNKDFFDQSLDEIKLLQLINSGGDADTNHILRLLDFFYYKEHLFIVSELLSENLYDFGKFIRDNGAEAYFTIPRLKKISKQVLEALDYVHSLNLIHCDLKPENIVIKSYSRCEVKLIDFGSSSFITDQLSTYIQSRSYRAPEVIIGTPYDYKIDVWSYGAVLSELYTGLVLFQNDSLPMMLARITGILGPFPEHILRAGKETPAFFTASNIVYDRIGPNTASGPGSGNGQRRHGWDRVRPIDADETLVLIYPKKTSLAARLHLLDATEDSDEYLLLDFVKCMLDLDPLTRPTAAEALKHPWLRDVKDVDEWRYQPA